MMAMITTNNKLLATQNIFFRWLHVICDEPIFRCLIRFYTKYKIGAHEVISSFNAAKTLSLFGIVRKKGWANRIICEGKCLHAQNEKSRQNFTLHHFHQCKKLFTHKEVIAMKT